MTVLIAPLNWGLGHASRCVPLVQRYLNEGNEVILGGDGESLTLLRRHFPKLRYVYLAPLRLRYSSGKRQVWAMAKALPHILIWAWKDHVLLQSLLRNESINCVISDNRFGLFSKQTECVYMTHQLHILLPKGWKWAERIVSYFHACVCKRYNKVWVPDNCEFAESLAGALSHPDYRFYSKLCSVSYIGPLSRFLIDDKLSSANGKIFDVVAVLSGLEPHRSFLEKEIITRYSGTKDKVLVVQGLMHRPYTRITRENISIVPYMGDVELAIILRNANHIIARSGYSTIMDLKALGVLKKAELIPTPGQTEQEYLAEFHHKRIVKL